MFELVECAQNLGDWQVGGDRHITELLNNTKGRYEHTYSSSASSASQSELLIPSGIVLENTNGSHLDLCLMILDQLF